MAEKPLYVMRWALHLPKRCYYIRGLNSAGRFYGSVRHFDATGGRSSNAEGQLNAEKLTKVIEFAERIRARKEPLPARNSEYRGVLADGPISHAAASLEATIYRAAAETVHTPSGKDFTQITEIIERHIPE